MTRKEFVLKYYMWGYQPHFRLSLQSQAATVFEKLSPLIVPSISLVGKLAEPDSESHPVCPDPEDAYDISIFQSLDETIEKISKADPERNLIHSHPVAADNHRRRIINRWLRDGLLTAIRSEDTNGVFFGSSPQLVGKYKVMVVARFDKEQYEKFYCLKRQEVEHRMHVRRSLIEATAYEFLSQAATTLKTHTEKASMGIDAPADEIIRSAARSLMYTPAHYGQNIYGLHGLYDACENLSLHTYEKAEASGKLILAKPDHPNIETIVRFTNPPNLRKVRAIRKLLETSSQNIALLTDSHQLYGLGKVIGTYDETREDLYEIHFTKKHRWSLSHAGHILLLNEDGVSSLPKEKLSKEKILSDLSRIFPENSPEMNLNMFHLIEGASKQRHGTMLVISPAAQTEADRLAGQSTPINPIALTEDLVGNLSSIDGAILLSPDGKCHSIGVVLDGMATKKGDPGRGARYNSAVKYIEQHQGTLAIVISEDGSINLVPDLRPRLPRAWIDDKIIEAKKELESTSPDVGVLNSVIQWLEETSFYLANDDCEIANRIIKYLDEHPYELGDIRIQYQAFKPHEEMNPSYYS